MRKIYEVSHGTTTLKVHWNSEWQEYRVRLYRNGEAYEPGDAFTSERKDATDTADAMLRFEIEQGRC